MTSIQQRYKKRIQRYERLLSRQNQYINRIGNARLLVFIGGGAASILLYKTGNYYLSAGVLGSAIILFFYLVHLYRTGTNNKKYAAALLRVNQDSLKRLEGEWKGFHDTGEDFMDEEHRYSYDLDIVGPGSLFQWTNTTNTPGGRQKLAQIFLTRPHSAKDVHNRQKAVDELAGKIKWRQRFMAEGLLHYQAMEKTDSFFEWIKDRNPFILKPEVIAVLRVFPMVTIITGLLALFPGWIPYQLPVGLLIIHYLLLRLGRKRRFSMFAMAEKYEKDITVYARMLEWIEKEKVSSEHLIHQKAKLVNRKGQYASRQIKNLSGIVESISNRYNGFYFFYNLLTLVEYQSFIALEKWKTDSGDDVKNWLDTIGEFEALSSMALIRFDHPEWVMPVIEEGKAKLVAKNVGHPLLGSGRVCNDITIREPYTILLITGSNMSGKSTLLRTAGINLVLAYAGAPVCAREFRCTLLELHTCMRVSDNLEMSISSFYAELIRIKNIIEAVKKDEAVFFLLDEIFKGTNSQDRHTGAKVLIRKLSRTGSLGMVSTHDLELGSLEKERGSKVQNYHFSEQYDKDTISFDYKLKPGISTTRNARYLMRLAGIEIDEEEQD